jgi:hypothetical protein
MENINQKFQNLTPNQKILFSVLATIVVFLIISLSLFFDSNNKTTKGINASPNPVATQNPVALGKTPNPSVQNPKTYLYKGKNYTVIYPSSWKTQLIPGTTEQQTTFFPDSNLPGSYSPSLKIRVGDYNQTDFVKIDSDHSLFFKKELVQFKGIQAEKFTGILPPAGFKGLVTKSTYSTAYLFTSNNKTFLIEYVYDGNILNTEWEQNFSIIINTIQFTP